MFRFATACAVALACLSPAAAQDKRVALVIGNAAYTNGVTMKTALNDAGDIGAALTRMGFSVTRVADAGRAAMDRALDEFRGKAKSADVAVVFYGGHAIQSDGVNWLVPVDGKLDSLAGVMASAVKLDSLVDAMADVRQFGVVLMDAPRSNPFPEPRTKAPRTSAPPVPASDVGRAPKDLIMVFATAPNQRVAAGPERNSPFTAAVLKHIETPSLTVEALTQRIRDEVVQTTAGKQIPWTYATLSGEPSLMPR